MPSRPRITPAEKNFDDGWRIASTNPLFRPISLRASVHRTERQRYPPQGWAYAGSNGSIYVHPKKLADPDEWVWIFAHCFLHLGMGHFQQKLRQREWDLACDIVVYRFLDVVKIGRAPEGLRNLDLSAVPVRDEDGLFRYFCDQGIPADLPALSITGAFESDMIFQPSPPPSRFNKPPDWQTLFGEGLALAVDGAVQSANVESHKTRNQSGAAPTRAQRARSWFMSSYPLLGALATAFDLIEDQLACHRMEISVAAVNAYAREIYMNPAAGLSELECRFVMAHELLHVALEHQKRRKGRDPELWNVACDYVINAWLLDMSIGAPPAIGLLHDPTLAGLSAEAVYDRIVKDLRRYRKLRTFRGVGLGDMLDGSVRDWWMLRDGVELDDYYRRCLAQGFHYHETCGRGLIPAGLAEEIRALSQPPIPWDVELARWFDDHFPPVEKRQSYARLSRRQSATPDIVRPRWVRAVPDEQRTFGVILDTSGSMDRTLLAEALGAIASYSSSRDVPLVRVVFCDAQPYDEGWMSPDDLAGRVVVKGRGGTVLQPGIDLLENAEDFPKDGPLLVITDGFCNLFVCRRDHAVLLPEGRSVPPLPKRSVFYLG